jgi:hypothetical protein
MEWTIARWVVLEGYYLRQKDWRSSPQFVNAIGATLQIYIRRAERKTADRPPAPPRGDLLR